jgi:hypothetical protein
MKARDECAGDWLVFAGCGSRKPGPEMHAWDFSCPTRSPQKWMLAKLAWRPPDVIHLTHQGVERESAPAAPLARVTLAFGCIPALYPSSIDKTRYERKPHAV